MTMAEMCGELKFEPHHALYHQASTIAKMCRELKFKSHQALSPSRNDDGQDVREVGVQITPITVSSWGANYGEEVRGAEIRITPCSLPSGIDYGKDMQGAEGRTTPSPGSDYG